MVCETSLKAALDQDWDQEAAANRAVIPMNKSPKPAGSPNTAGKAFLSAWIAIETPSTR